MKSYLLTAAAGLAIAPVLYSQEFRGAIGGAVTDATGALIAAARAAADRQLSGCTLFLDGCAR
jgi:hypothetical protein